LHEGAAVEEVGGEEGVEAGGGGVMADKVTGHLEVGCNDHGEVVINHPKMDVDAEGVGHLVFSPGQARGLGLLMLRKAAEADGFPGTGEGGEYFIDFNTQIEPGKLQAVRVRLDLVTISNLDIPMDVGLCDHPLFDELRRYVKANPRR
jgi:hypothetical protein